MKNILKVRMLGGFTLEYKGKELVLDRNNVSKTTQLFQLLLLHTQDGEISKAALIDALYGRSDVENKNGSLNNTIFSPPRKLSETLSKKYEKMFKKQNHEIVEEITPML